MIIDKNFNNQFSKSFNNYPIIGFHATSSIASNKIEKEGFLPNKILDAKDHEIILSEGRALGIDVIEYEGWLEMNSITFTKQFYLAMDHLNQGSSCGQGTSYMLEVLRSIESGACSKIRMMATNYINMINKICNASSVIYAVDLSHVGNRLVNDKHQPDLYHIYFDKDAPLPSESLVAPTHLIARLDIT
jgi:hypothetical protein